MRTRVWVRLGLLAFLGGSLLRLGVETGAAGFTMFGMIAFVLIGLLAVQEASGLQTRAGWRRLERVLRSEAEERTVLRLPAGVRGGTRYLVRAGSAWVAVGVDTSSEAGLWALVRPALLGRTRRLREQGAGLPLGAPGSVVPALVLLRRKARDRERAMGEPLGVHVVNPEALPGLFQEIAAGDDLPGDSGLAAAAGKEEEPQAVAGLARRLGAEVVSGRGGERVSVEGARVNTYPVR